MPNCLRSRADAVLWFCAAQDCNADTPFDGLVHGHDERVGLEAFAFGVQALYETVHDFCARP